MWLCSWRTSTGRPRCPYPEVVEEAICFGWIDSTAGVLDADRGLQLITPRNPKSPWTRLNRAEQREATALFVDIVGSTAMAEVLPAGEVLATLNAFFAAVVTCVHDEGGWDGRTDFQLLEPLVLTPAKRKALVADDPDPDVFWRIELFYGAVAAAVEHRTGIACQTMLKMHHEGFGRLVLVAGRLVVLSHYLRDVQRFGFDSLEALAEAGERLVSESVEAIERFPEVARLGS